MTEAPISTQIAERRRVEDALLKLGAAHAEVENIAELNRTAIKAWIEPARAAGISVRDFARLTGFSAQTVHAWMREGMKPVWAAHLGFGDPPAQSLEESVLRAIAEDPDRDWLPSDVRPVIPEGWPTGELHEIKMALEWLVRSGQIWRTDDGYRLGDPNASAL